MIKTAIAALMGVGLAAIAAGGAYAQDGAMRPSDGKMMMSGGMMSKKMSDKDMATLKMCKAMSHESMMRDHRCMDLQKAHPDAMKMDDGMKMDPGMKMDSGSMMKK
jgi:hypothetical protein